MKGYLNPKLKVSYNHYYQNKKKASLDKMIVWCERAVTLGKIIPTV